MQINAAFRITVQREKLSSNYLSVFIKLLNKNKNFVITNYAEIYSESRKAYFEFNVIILKCKCRYNILWSILYIWFEIVCQLLEMV